MAANMAPPPPPQEQSIGVTPSPSTSSKTPSPPPPLPLGWTQISRNGDNNNNNNNKSTNAELLCCEDPSCRRRRAPHSAATTTESTVTLQGQAIFLWCEIDPKWFQGYFTVRGCKPLGLLAQQTDVDECLACVDGGYREISLKIYQKPYDMHTILEVAWTGGDMMKLSAVASHGLRIGAAGASTTSKKLVGFQTERLLTGKKAVPLVEQYFSGLIQKLQADSGEEEPPASILDLIPDVAILVGNMTLSLPKRE